MALTNQANGTQAATLNTEHTLSGAFAVAGVYILTVNLKNLANGDVVELRAYQKCLTGDVQSYLAYKKAFSNVQGDAAAVGSNAQGPVLAISIPVPSVYSVTFTLRQTTGTGRNFDWRIDTL